MRLSLHSILRDRQAWEKAGVTLPCYDVPAMVRETTAAPVWLHLGAGNIFRGFIAALQQRLLNTGAASKGIIAAETFDEGIVDRVYAPFDNLAVNVVLMADATIQCELIASIAEAIVPLRDAAQRARLMEIAAAPSLQMISLTITEKGYGLRQADGRLTPSAQEDIQNGPALARHTIGLLAAALHRRYETGALPVALVSMDNCARNGEKLQQGLLTMAEGWRGNGLVESGFVDYLKNPQQVACPWSMIDKITPRPAQEIHDVLAERGIEGMEPLVTAKGAFVAPFVNAEHPGYLVIEDAFPNGRPPLERAGVHLTDRDTVSGCERMKVTTCLNPLHTAMSVYGCLLGYTRISDEMKDPDILALINRLGYREGLPVVSDPGVLSPHAFLEEVLRARLPNPFVPDAPQRIATDTSQKVGIRFGETIKSYIARGDGLESLRAIPLAIAGWLRYLLAVDDEGRALDVSPDPRKDALQASLRGIQWNQPQSYRGELAMILSDASIFGLDLTKTPLAATIERMFVRQLAGKGAVRATLRAALGEAWR